MTKVENIPHFERLVREGKHDFVIAFGGGLVSRKNVWYVRPRRYGVFHSIDGHFETLTLRDLLRTTNIGKAIRRGVFYAE